MIAYRVSGLARWRGILRLSRRQLQQRWLESLFIVLGIAMGVGVFTGMETFVRFAYTMSSQELRLNPQAQGIRVMPRRVDFNTFRELGSVPAIRLGQDLETPVEFALADLLGVREAVSRISHAFLPESWSGQRITSLDGQNVLLPDLVDGGSQGADIQIQIATPDELTYRQRRFLAGTPFTWDDFVQGERRIVIEEETAERLFPGLTPEDIVGRTFTTGWGHPGEPGTLWQIIGVVERIDESMAGRAFHFDTNLLLGYAPPGTGDHGTIREFYVIPAEPEDTEDVIREVQAYFDQMYGPGRVHVREPQASISELGVIISILALSGLALLIAAVNILNLFTARVLRRQRHTGMSLALGATRTMLFWQTSGEALLLGVVGSTVGLMLARGIVSLLAMFLRMQMGEFDTAAFDPLAGLGLTSIDAAIGLTLGTMISLIFGLYPAFLAARQNPAEALRTD